MDIRYLSKRAYREKYGTGTAGQHWTEDGKHIIELPRGASTKTRMHEIAHAELGHEGTTDTLGEAVRREIAADVWVYSKLGREPSVAEVIIDLEPAMEVALEARYSGNELTRYFTGELEAAGYDVTPELLAALRKRIHYIRKFIKGEK